ncbi:aminotransferase class V-fold PLP-dependent enzyme [Candidatus Kaiserbacteria bacterium]|nr:aminotransferase class V-fold PLP-dependent enzyme [Candidatus Kaiserbacteria bacterium]
MARGKGQQEKPSGRQEAERAREARDAAVERLKEIEIQRLATRRATGHHEPEELDIEGCVRSLQSLARPTMPQIRTLLIQHRIHPDVATHLHVATGHDVVWKSEGLKEHIRGECMRALDLASTHFKGGGSAFLRTVIASSIEEKQRLDPAHTQRLQKLVGDMSRRGYREDEIAAIYIAYASLNEKTLAIPGRSGQEVLLEKVEALVRAQSQLDANTLRSERDGTGTFFERLLRCLSVYADISEQVIKRSGTLASEVQDRAARSLSLLLQRPEFLQPRWSSQAAVDPFQVLQNMLADSPGENPWLRESLDNTPFDAQKFWTLITQDVPRGLLAEAVVGLNGYQDSLLAQRATMLRNSIRGTIEKGATPSPTVESQCRELVKDYTRAHPEKARPHLSEGQSDPLVYAGDLGEWVQETEIWLKEIERLNVWRSRASLREANHVHPIAALLRIINPRNIVENDSIRHQFTKLFEQLTMPLLEDIAPETKEWKVAQQQIAIIAASVRDILSQDDPYLDVPISGAHDQQSLRMMLMRFALSRFDSEIISNGAYAHLEGKIAFERPLFVPQNLRSVHIERLRKNFDTAAGVAVHPDTRNTWTRRAAETWSRFPNFYKRALNFTTALVKKFYGLNDNYSVAFYRSATNAIGDVVTKLIRIQTGDRVIITNQEYQSITKEFKEQGATIGENEIVYMNDRERGVSLNANEMFAQIQGTIKKGVEPKAIILSSKSRFGDALCAGRSLTPKMNGMQDLIQRLKLAYPRIPVVIDDSQGIGRNDIAERNIKDLGCDIFINSGSKATGLDNVATLILKTKFEPGQENWLDIVAEERRDSTRDWLDLVLPHAISDDPISRLQPGTSTDYVIAIAELGMVMQSLMGKINTWSLDPIPHESSLREVTAQRMRDLTEYFIKKSSEYHEDLLGGLDLALGTEDLSDKKYAEQFGCNIAYPIHRSKKDYNGIVTVAFPNVAYEKKNDAGDVVVDDKRNIVWRLDYLPRELAKMHIRVLPCLHNGDHALRISFNMAHEFSDAGDGNISSRDIDQLFEAIKKIHTDFLIRHIKEKNIRNYNELCERTPNVPSTWMPN